MYLVASMRGEEGGREAGGVVPRLVLGALLLFDKEAVENPSSTGAPLYWN